MSKNHQAPAKTYRKLPSCTATPRPPDNCSLENHLRRTAADWPNVSCTVSCRGRKRPRQYLRSLNISLLTAQDPVTRSPAGSPSADHSPRWRPWLWWPPAVPSWHVDPAGKKQKERGKEMRRRSPWRFWFLSGADNDNSLTAMLNRVTSEEGCETDR